MMLSSSLVVRSLLDCLFFFIHLRLPLSPPLSSIDLESKVNVTVHVAVLPIRCSALPILRRPTSQLGTRDIYTPNPYNPVL